MARVFEGISGGGDHSESPEQSFSAHEQARIDVPSPGFTADAHIMRDGQDLILTSPDGKTIEIEGYFSADTTPSIHAPDGSVLTPKLVHSFVQSAPEYAANETASDESPIGAAQEVKGDAFIVHADGTKEKLAVGAPVFEGDVIETSKEGAVNIVFVDETSLAVSENARIALDNYSFDAATESGAQDISVLRGVFVFTSGLIGRDDPDDVHINTPVGSIGIRGTIIAGHINPGGESEISVLEGAIVVKNDVNEVVLTQQYEVVKLTGNDSAIENHGVLEAGDISDRFGAVSDVIPALFSAVNDSAKEQTDFTVKPAAEAPADATQEAGEATAEEGAEDIPTDTLEPPADPLPQDMMLDQPMMDNPLGDKPLFDIRQQGEFRPGGAPLPGTFEFKPDAPIGDRPPLIDPLRTFDPLQPPPQLLNNNTTGGGTTGTNNTVYGLTLNTATTTDGVSKVGDNANNRIGYSLSGVGDANNDGYDDLIFSNNTNAVGQNHTYVMYGSVSGISSGSVLSLNDAMTVYLNDPDASAGDLGLLTNNATASFDHSVVTGIGDFDGDGVEDYLVGQPNVDTNGKAYIVSGANPGSYIAIAGYDDLGYSVTGVGDINNDGRDDVLIGAPGADKAHLITGGTWGTPINVTSAFSGYTLSGNTGSRFGESAEGIGDLDGDGKMDYVVASPFRDVGGTDRGGITIYYGNNPATPGSTIAGDFDGQLFGKGLKSAGDFNGDGRSDFIAAGDTADVSGNYALKIFTHNGSGLVQNTILATNLEISGGGGVGDWNGDGYDDFSVALQKDANTAEIYVIYGRAGTIPSYDLADLQNPANAFKMIYNGYSSDVEISAVGDVNGDGYDDMGIGLSEFEIGNGGAPDGQVMIVNGRNTMQSSNSLVGTSGANTWTDTTSAQFESYSGGAGNDVLSVSDTSFRNLDGGTGVDALHVTTNGLIDFSFINFERISQIEEIHFTAPTGSVTTMTLTAENIFNLLQTSDTGTLKIEHSGSGTALLRIDAGSVSGATTTDQIINALNEHGVTATHAVAGSYDIFSVGGQPLLYIDTSIVTAVV